MLSVKKEAIDLIEKLPENVNFDDIIYEMYVLQKIEKGKEDLKNGKILKNEELEKESKKW